MKGFGLARLLCALMLAVCLVLSASACSLLGNKEDEPQTEQSGEPEKPNNPSEGQPEGNGQGTNGGSGGDNANNGSGDNTNNPGENPGDEPGTTPGGNEPGGNDPGANPGGGNSGGSGDCTHEAGEWAFLTPVSCMIDGVRIKACIHCYTELERETVSAPGHHTPSATPTVENEVAPTCTEDGGYDSVVYCGAPLCGIEISREHKTVPSQGHTPGAAIIENNVPATCTKVGSYDEVVYCAASGCGAEISRTSRTVIPLEHEDGNGDGRCDECGYGGYVRVNAAGAADPRGNYLLFGEYPQTIKAPSVSISAVTDSRGYYLGSDGEYYAKVTASPYGLDYTMSDGSSVTSGTIYYFKVEPIRWRILTLSDGNALMLCDSVIDTSAYQTDKTYNAALSDYYTSANGAPAGTYASSYEYSEVRRFLVNEFYNTAFVGLGRSLIMTTTVDNGEESMLPVGDPDAFSGRTDKYAARSTSDKVFLLSTADMTNPDYGFTTVKEADPARVFETSDYARATGVYMHYNGTNSDMWLRSPYTSGNYAQMVLASGGIGYAPIERAEFGVAPALWIALSHTPDEEWTVDVAPGCTTTGSRYKSCAVCGAELEREVVSAVGHIGADPVCEELVEPTCTATGSYYEVTYCSAPGCGYKISSVYRTIIPLGHEDANNDGYCDRCATNGRYQRVNKDGTPNPEGAYVLFGEYPQTVKDESVSIVSSTADSRGYYLGSDGAYYAKYNASIYTSGYTFSNGREAVYGENYYFKVEPIRWRILSDEGGTLTLLCDSIVERYSNNTSSNNYKDSRLRSWLNGKFLSTSFTEEERSAILTTTVKNDAVSTNPYGNPTYNNGGVNSCISEDTLDKVFALSVEEATNPAFGFGSYTALDEARKISVSDYAMATGVYVDTSSGYRAGYWTLRSPHWSITTNIRGVNYTGGIVGATVTTSTYGIVPAICVWTCD